MRDDSSEIRRCSRRNAIAAAGAGVAVASLGAVPAAAQSKVTKEVFHLGVPWEDQYGYAQAVKVGDTIYVSGQLSHDDQGKIIAPRRSIRRAGSPITATWARRWRRATPT